MKISRTGTGSELRRTRCKQRSRDDIGDQCAWFTQIPPSTGNPSRLPDSDPTDYEAMQSLQDDHLASVEILRCWITGDHILQGDAQKRSAKQKQGETGPRTPYRTRSTDLGPNKGLFQWVFDTNAKNRNGHFRRQGSLRIRTKFKC